MVFVVIVIKVVVSCWQCDFCFVSFIHWVFSVSLILKQSSRNKNLPVTSKVSTPRIPTRYVQFYIFLELYTLCVKDYYCFMLDESKNKIFSSHILKIFAFCFIVWRIFARSFSQRRIEVYYIEICSLFFFIKSTKLSHLGIISVL